MKADGGLSEFLPGLRISQSQHVWKKHNRKDEQGPEVLSITASAGIYVREKSRNQRQSAHKEYIHLEQEPHNLVRHSFARIIAYHQDA
jgi:hypothetical protein